QPPCQVFDPARVRAAEPKPRLLHCVVRIAQRSEHAIRDGTKSRPVSFELFGEPVLLVHRALHSRNPQPVDERKALNVTSAATPRTATAANRLPSDGGPRIPERVVRHIPWRQRVMRMTREACAL